MKPFFFFLAAFMVCGLLCGYVGYNGGKKEACNWAKEQYISVCDSAWHYAKYGGMSKDTLMTYFGKAKAYREIEDHLK